MDTSPSKYVVRCWSGDLRERDALGIVLSSFLFGIKLSANKKRPEKEATQSFILCESMQCYIVI